MTPSPRREFVGKPGHAMDHAGPQARYGSKSGWIGKVTKRVVYMGKMGWIVLFAYDGRGGRDNR